MLKKVHTDKAPQAIGPYSQAVICGNMLYTSGQIAINPASGEVEATDIEGQTQQGMDNLAAVLAEAGTSFDNVIKTTCFLKEMSDFAAFNKIYGETFTSKPARSCVAVKTLPKDVLVEGEVIAIIK